MALDGIVFEGAFLVQYLAGYGIHGTVRGKMTANVWMGIDGSHGVHGSCIRVNGEGDVASPLSPWEKKG
jgi:hypothetical protein